MTRFALLGVLLAGVLAACGGSGGGHTGTSSTTGSTSTDRAQITANFEQFFSSKTSASTRASLLQNGATFAPVIRAMSSSSLAANTKAKVTKVTLSGAKQAKVTYTIYLGNTPALKNQHGGAVQEGGTWKVSDATLCNLIALEGTKPAACKKLTG